MRRICAISLVLLAALAGCGDDDDTKAIATTTTTLQRTTTTVAPLPRSSSTVSGAALEDPAAAVRAWTDAIAAGDDDAAVALLAPRSLESIGGPEGFADERSALAEGWGAWGSVDDEALTVVALPYPPGTALVVLHGEVSQEGPPAESWAALPVVATEDGDRVEPFLDLGEVDVAPSGSSTIAPDQDFTAETPAGADVSFIIDDRDAVTPALSSVDGERISSSFTGGDPLRPGLHALTVVLADEDGVSARTFTYHVSG